MIEINGITIEYENKVVFDGYSQTFEENKVYAIVGKSGCGKSTLLRTIAGLNKPKSGDVHYKGEKLKDCNGEIFMMHQKYVNFPWNTCLENVLMPLVVKKVQITEEHNKKAISLLETVGLGKYVNSYPHELSGGMQQRLALARTLLSEPPVILMDEPLSALDPDTRSEMQNLVLQQHYKTKNTIIMVTHDLDEARKMSDKIIKLD